MSSTHDSHPLQDSGIPHIQHQVDHQQHHIQEQDLHDISNQQQQQQQQQHDQQQAQSLEHKIVGLFLWHDVLTSSIAVCCGLLVVFLIQWGGYSLITLISYIILLQLLICFIFINGTKLFLQATAAKEQQQTNISNTSSNNAIVAPPPLSTPYISSIDGDDLMSEYNYVSQSLVLEYSGVITDSINSLCNSCVEIVRCGNNWYTLKVMLMLFLISVVGRLLDGITIIGILWILAFIVPKLYLHHQNVVDDRINQVRNGIEEIRQFVERKLPVVNIRRKTHTKDKKE